MRASTPVFPKILWLLLFCRKWIISVSVESSNEILLYNSFTFYYQDSDFFKCLKLCSSQACSQPVFSGKPEGPFCLSCTFIFLNERNWVKKSARVSEKLVRLGLPGLQVATHLPVLSKNMYT